MAAKFQRSAAPLITTIQKLFSEDLAKENDFLRQENKILRSKLGKRVPLTEADRRTLVRYGLSIKERLAEVMTIVRPETLLAWNRRMKRQKWTFNNTAKRPGRPSKGKVTEELALRMAGCSSRLATSRRRYHPVLGGPVSPGADNPRPVFVSKVWDVPRLAAAKGNSARTSLLTTRGHVRRVSAGTAIVFKVRSRQARRVRPDNKFRLLRPSLDAPE